MRALVMSGGGVFGAHQVGALQSMVKANPNLDYKYMGGISIGSVNIAYLAQAPCGELPKYVKKLHQLWSKLSGSKDIWRRTFWGYLRFFFRPSFYRTEALRKLIDGYFDMMAIQQAGRVVRMGAADLKTGRYCEGTETDPMLMRWVLASSAHPLFFPPERMYDAYFTDGCIRHALTLGSAIKIGCKKIDLLLTTPSAGSLPTLPDKELSKGPGIAERTLDIMLDQLMVYELKLCLDRNRLASKTDLYDEIEVYVYAPKRDLTTVYPSKGVPRLDFAPAHIKALYEEGLKCTPCSMEEFLQDKNTGRNVPVRYLNRT